MQFMRRNAAEKLGTMTRRYDEPQTPYYGFEGLFDAADDGKVWLNNLSFLHQILADFILQEIRFYSHKISGLSDQVPSQWPDIAGSSCVPAHQKRWFRIANFLRIFSGCDSRFAYDDNFLPGGGLELRLVNWIGDEDYDPRSDARSTLWNYPIDAHDPLAAPANMRLVNMWFNSWDLNYYGMATSVLSADLRDVMAGTRICVQDPTDSSKYSFGKLNEYQPISEHFHSMLCEWVSILSGTDSEILADQFDPAFSDAHIFFCVRNNHSDKIGKGKISITEPPEIKEWRTLEEIFQ